MAISSAGTWKYDDDGEMSAQILDAAIFKVAPTLQKHVS